MRSTLFSPRPRGDEFEQGAELPLDVALRIVVELNDGQEQTIACLPGRLAYTQTHLYSRQIVYHPS